MLLNVGHTFLNSTGKPSCYFAVARKAADLERRLDYLELYNPPLRHCCPTELSMMMETFMLCYLVWELLDIDNY